MTDNLIEIRNLNVAFHGQTVVRDLCLDIRAGECLALVGESGSGKSVTAHSILQLLPDSEAQTTGSISAIAARNWSGLNPRSCANCAVIASP